MKIRKPTRAGTVLAGVVLVLSLSLVPAAFAGKGGGGKPGGGSGSSISQPVMVADTGTAGLSAGDKITFNVSTSVTWPSVEVDCVQNGALVYQGIVGFYPTYAWSRDYTLQSYSWTGGAADCTARLYTTGKNGSQQTLATLSFSVGA